MVLYWIVVYAGDPAKGFPAFSAFPFQNKRHAERFAIELRRRDLLGRTIKDDDNSFDAWSHWEFDAWVDANYYYFLTAGTAVAAAEAPLERLPGMLECPPVGHPEKFDLELLCSRIQQLD